VITEVPSAMIHLTAARVLFPDAPTIFYLGNVAPDAVSERERKDKTHFRDLPDREKALFDFASAIEEDDYFRKGVLFHLFCDDLWDNFVTKKYIKANFKSGEDWFHPYRNEIAHAGAWIFHNRCWGDKLWSELQSCAENAEIVCPYLDCKKEDIVNYLSFNGRWHRESNLSPSEHFTPDFVDSFAADAAAKHRDWLKKYGLFNY